MAAALGYTAARRLSGLAVRQTQVGAVERLSSAVAQEQRLLLPRLVHGDQHPCTCGMYEKSGDLRQIQKKEELYDLLFEARRKYGVKPDQACRSNGNLLNELSAHVEPRPQDPTW